MNVKLYGVWVFKELFLFIYFRLFVVCRLEESLFLVLFFLRFWERIVVFLICGKLIFIDFVDML